MAASSLKAALIWIHAVPPANVPVQLLPLARKYLQHERHLLELGRVVLQIHMEDLVLHPHVDLSDEVALARLGSPNPRGGRSEGSRLGGKYTTKRPASTLFDFHHFEIATCLGFPCIGDFCRVGMSILSEFLHFGISSCSSRSAFWNV